MRSSFGAVQLDTVFASDIVRGLVPLMSAALLVGGCTTAVRVTPVNVSDNKSRVGAPYALPFTQYEIAINREVIGCGSEIKIKTSAEIRSALTRPDPMARFSINPNSLSSPLKTSEIKLEYDANGVATSLNATAEDRSAQIIANVVGSVAKIVSIGVTGRALTENERKNKEDACSDDVLKARENIPGQKRDVNTAKAAVTALTEELKGLQLKAAALGGNLDPQTKARLSRTYDALAAATEVLSAHSDALATSLQVIRDTQIVHWPSHGRDLEGKKAIPPFVMLRWVNPLSEAAKEVEQGKERFSAFFLLEPLTNIDPSSDAPAIWQLKHVPEIDPLMGIPFRRPEAGKLLVCAGQACGAGVEPIAEKISDIPQLGMVYYLPCQSRPFSSIACNFTMASDGTLKSIGSAQKAATAEGASGALLSTLTTAEGVAGTLSTAKQKKLQAATAELKAQAEYDAAKAALRPSANADVIAATAAARANLDLYQALKAEADARAVLEQQMTASP